ncbi:MAG TPA: hypothetical protein VN969_47895 [Streptosporangiaceae bacterium]|nr:hypothetical protein [Streptosporangiaceae bacterium]
MESTRRAAQAGKIVTIYPADEAACERILADLGQLLDGEPGPYILSDLRYGAGPLYVRYGGFTEQHCLDARGELVPAIEDLAGNLVPDVRAPVFSMPAWVQLPSFLASSMAARNAATIDELPYEIVDVLHFSNGGGVYAGTDRQTGERVILKEARPYAGLAADGSDAVARLRREHDVLRALSGLGIAPEVRGYFEPAAITSSSRSTSREARNSCYSARYPLLTADPDPVIFNDLHMFNIMVRPDDSVVLIDFEAASYLSEGRRVTVGNPEFVAPRDRTLDRSKAAHIAAVIAELFGAPAAFLDEAVREIVGTAPVSGAKQGLDWGTTGRSDIPVLARSVAASATPGRTDRLFPGDIEQFAVPGGGLGIAHGAAGVLYALTEAADLRIPEFEEWLVSARPTSSAPSRTSAGACAACCTRSRRAWARAWSGSP